MAEGKTDLNEEANDLNQAPAAQIGKSDLERIARTATSAATWLLTAVCAVAILGAALFFAAPRFLGWQGVIVLSGSMEPSIKTGGLVFIQHGIDPTTLKRGDVITFDYPGTSNVYVTHRIRDIGIDETGLWFQTKGDANENPDETLVHPQGLIGQEKMTVPYVGYAADWLRNRQHLYLILWIPAVLLIGGELSKIAGQWRQGRKPADKMGEHSLAVVLVGAVVGLSVLGAGGSQTTYATFTRTHSATSQTLQATSLAAPTLDSATPSGSGITGSVTLSWSYSDTAANRTTDWQVFRAPGSCSGTPSFSLITTVARVSSPDGYGDSPLSAGTYCYAIKGKQSGFTGPYSNFVSATIAKATTSISTSLSASTIATGISAHDSATLAGFAPGAGGTVTYAIFTDNTCSTLFGTQPSPATVTVTSGAVPDSANVAFNSTGTFYWRASYSGDSNNLGATSNCTDEVLTVISTDGSGTLTTPTTNVAASSTGNTITFTYTAATGGLSSGEVDVAVPVGWTAPKATNATGCTTVSAGTLSFSGQTIRVSALTLSAGGTLTVTYGATSGGACTASDGATAASSTGAQTWQGQEKSTAGGTLTNLASSPSITVNAANGSGTLTTPTTSVLAASTGNTIVFTYTAAAGGLSSGEVDIAVPSGWTAPVSTNAIGCTTASTGTLSFTGQTIKVSSLTLAGSATLTVTYGATSGGACTASDGATATSTVGAQTWQGQEKSVPAGTLTNLASSPSITVNNAADGSGTLTTPTTNVAASSTGDTITFTYTAATGGLSSGEVDVAVPVGWTAPKATNATGCTTVSAGTLSFSGQTIRVSALTLSAGGTLTVTYGATSGGACTASDGATAASSTGAQTWQGQEKSTAGGTLTNLASSPSITVNAANGSGTLTTPTTSVLAASTGNTIVFTYTAAAGGLSSGEVDIAVPSGWTAPVSTNAIGCTTASTGTLSFTGQTIKVSSLTLAGSATLTVTYGATSGGACTASDGATATSTVGAQTWQGQEKSVPAGTLTNLASSPSITVNNAADGSGTLTTPTTNVAASSTGDTITFTYTAATGGLNNGAITLVVPAGWSAPSTTGSAAGFTTASTGTVSVASQTVTVSGVTLSGSATFTIIYGSKASSGPGATAPSTAGAQTWQGQEKSTSGGTLTNLASSPSIIVNNAADGSGTLTTTTTNVGASSIGNTIAFTYTAAAGGLSSGEVDIAVPSGWTAPTASNAVGCTTVSVGTLSFSGQTIKVSALTLASNATLTVTYGATSGGACTASDGATATASIGAQTWQGLEKSTAGGTLTNLASSPSITVNALAITSVVRDAGNRKYDFTGTGASGAAAITVTICTANSFPCSGGNTAGTAVTVASPPASWTSGQDSLNLGNDVEYWAQASQGSATSPVFPFYSTNTTPAVKPSGVVMANGGTLGKADAGDTLTVTYGEPMDASTFCSTWTNTGTQNSSASVQIVESGTNDVLNNLTVSGCTFHFGSVALGTNANYVSSTVTFGSSTVVWDPANLTLTITLGGGTGQNTSIAASTPSYTADTAIKDRNGVAIVAGPPWSGTNSRY